MVFGILVAGTFVQPLFHFADERFHVDMIFAATDGDGYPDVKDRSLSPKVGAAAEFWNAPPAAGQPLPPRPLGELSEAACALDDGDVSCRFKPTFGELASIAQDQGPVNRMTQHPPAYYLAVGTTSSTLTSLTMRVVPYDAQVWLYRMLSAVLALSLPLLTALALRELEQPVHVRAAGVALPALVPGFTLRSGVLVSNDALLYPLISGILLLLLVIARRGVTTKRLVATGVLLGVALLTKGTAMLVAVAIPPSLYLLSDVTHPWRRRLREAARHTMVIAMVALICGGWWILRNVLLHGTPQPAGIRRPDAAAGFEPDAGAWAIGYAKGLARTSLGEVGRDLVNSPLLFGLAALALAAVLTLGVRALGWRVSLVLNLPAILIFLGWTTNSYLSYLRTGSVVAWNARYYFVAMLGVCVLLAVGLRVATRRLPVVALPAAVVLGVAWTTRADAWFWLSRYWSTDGTWSGAFDTMSAWAPAPFSVFVIALGCSVLAGFIAAILPASAPAARNSAELAKHATS